MIKNWNTQKFKNEVLNNLNGDRAGEFIKHDARRRLLNIREPKWGAGYRRSIVSSLVDYTVERLPNEVIISVGVKPSSATRHHGFYIEMGSHTHGPQPFLRPAVFENGSKIVQLLGDSG